MCPFLADYPDKTLFKIDVIDSSAFILDTDCEWPDDGSHHNMVLFQKIDLTTLNFIMSLCIMNEKQHLLILKST